MKRVESISVTETAKIIRRKLKEHFHPSVKFSVTCRKYAGGSSIYVSWTGNPKVGEVVVLTNQYVGKTFDARDDSSTCLTHLLFEDESTCLTTEMLYTTRPHRLVQFMCDHIYCRRYEV